MICPKCYSKVPAGATQCGCGFQGAEPTPEPPPVVTKQQAENADRHRRILGLLVCGGIMAAGILLTIASHDAAVERGGGRYRIFTGLIACGGIGMFRVLSSAGK